MDKAKHAVSSFLHKSGQHDTTVHESVAPAIQKETVKEHRREEQQIARDREVHQDHYHTSVQPVHDREVLQEQHHHNLAGVEHRTHDHRDHATTKDRLQQEAGQFKNESIRAPTAHTTTNTVPEVTGEHVHHHVHEKIQPVVHKETIEQHVVHTTVPVHETHYNEAKHHNASALPAVSMDEFKKHGGALTGRDVQHDHFAGEPNSIEKALGRAGHHDVGHPKSHHTSNTTSDAARYATPGSDAGRYGTNATDSTRHGTNASDGTRHGITASEGSRHAPTESHTSKPSLMDRLNPMKDSNGDGTKGFMK